MILRSIVVQGWRCFANPVSVGPFTEGLNVLHASNAAGKSTLFEAMRLGLLDGHRVTGRDVENLRPWGRALAPTVTVAFSHGAAEYQVMKRFLDHPFVELERRENETFVRVAEGDAADQKIREILTRNPPGRGLSRPENRGLAQVLWAPQGDLSFGKLSGDLVADIRTALDVQVSGPGSGALEERIDAAYLRFFTSGGQYKRGKDAPALARLHESLPAAIEAQRTAAEQQRVFEDAARRVEDFRARRAQARRDAEALTKSLHQARARAEAYKALVSDRAQRVERVKAAEARHGELKQRIEAIKAVVKELSDVQQTIVRLRSELPAWIREVEQQEMEAARTKRALEVARAVRRAGHQVLEVNRGDRRTRRIAGKSDTVDAETAARSVLAGQSTAIPKTADGAVEMMRHLKVARRTAVKARTSAMITLKQIVVTAPPELRETLHPLADQALLKRCRGWRCGTIDTPTASAKHTLRALARRWFALSVEIVDHDRHLGRLTTQTSPTLREGFGIGADTAAEMLIIFGDNPDRIHAEAAFAKLCGACPIPASSGMTTGRHRLYRGGHRQANAALHRAVIVRMRYHSPTLNDVERRTAEGRPKREIIRCLKRFLAREIFQRVMADYRARQAADLAA